MTTTVLVRPAYLNLEAFSRASGLHPEMVARLVDLGLLDARRNARAELFFPPRQLARADRIRRLREGLAVNYAALGLVLDLLDRIETLEATRRAPPPPPPPGGTIHQWTRTA
jgi:hypothetical protein